MLPDAERARIDRAKVVDYLLSRTHPDGRSKAEFFTRFGFKAEGWQQFAEALKALGISNPVAGVVQSSHGTRYTVNGPLQPPTDGRRAFALSGLLNPGIGVRGWSPHTPCSCWRT
jgi:hypothetical protein